MQKSLAGSELILASCNTDRQLLYKKAMVLNTLVYGPPSVTSTH